MSQPAAASARSGALRAYIGAVCAAGLCLFAFCVSRIAGEGPPVE